MSIAVSKKTRLRRLEESLTRVCALPIAERLRLAKLKAEKYGTRTPAEYLAHMERRHADNPNALTARLLRAAKRVAEMRS